MCEGLEQGQGGLYSEVPYPGRGKARVVGSLYGEVQ